MIELGALVSEMSDWVADPENKSFMFDEQRAEIEEKLGSLTKDLAVDVADSLETLASWYGPLGATRVLGGEPAGWEDLTRSLSYRASAIRAMSALFEDPESPRLRGGKNLARNGALSLAHAVATGDSDTAEWCFKRLLTSLDDGFFIGWDSPLAPFMLKLYGRCKGHAPDLSRREGLSLGVYAAVFEAWDSDPHLANVLKGLCSYHLSRVEDSHDRDVPEFEEYPYTVFPVEIISVLRLREEAGMNRIPVSHELMSTPLAEPVSVEHPKDELLTRAIEAIEAIGVKMSR